MIKLASYVDVGGAAVHASACHKAAFDQFVRIFTHDFSVLASARFAFIGIDDEVARLGVFVPIFEVHKRLRQLAQYEYVGDKLVDTHFMPEGNPAPPRPRRPEALISEMIYHIFSNF